MPSQRIRALFSFPAVLLAFVQAALTAQPVPFQLFSGLEWRLIGPFRGGRVLAVTGVPGDSRTFYFGAVGGGIWKTTDTGMVWKPIFDSQRIASIGAIAVAPSDPNIIYAGSGEADMRSDISFGDGIYKSTDAGQTWTNIGLRDSRQIGRIAVHPKDPNIVYVAALGHAYGPNSERGVYRSSDGGRTWRKVLDKGPDVGAIDLDLLTDDPGVIYAAMWRSRRPPWSTYAPLEGPGSGLYKSTDGGDSWTQLQGGGLPDGDWGRVGVAIAPGTHGQRIYALIEAKAAGLYRSDDGGKTWTHAGSDPRITSRAWYFSGVTADPKNPDVVYLPNVALYRTSDAGKSFSVVRGAPGGDDYHSLWIDPTDSSRMILGTDQGTTISVDGAKTWSTWYNQPTGQFYHVVTDNQFPYYVYGSQQDSGTAAVASRTDHGQITERDWFSVGGGESGYIAPDPRDPNVVYVNNTNGTLTRFDKRTSSGQVLTLWPAPAFGSEINMRKYRHPWTSPLVFSPNEPNTLYYGAQYVMKTTDGGLNWKAISPDLTGDARHKGEPAPSDSTSVENAKARGYGTVYTIAPSFLKVGQIWAGTDTGLVHLTRDGGKTWTNVTPPGLPDWSKITLIEPSHFDPGTAYAAVDRHRLEDYKPYLYRTRDFGKSWTAVANGIEEPAFLNAVREDPARKGLLFAGTELGVYVSFDDGDHWQPLQLNLPVTSVRDLAIHGDDLVIATHGRSFWILDNITVLRQLNSTIATSDAWLYQPATAVRTISEGFQGTPLPPEIPTAKNPPAGAILDYYLKASQDEVSIEILDRANQVVRRYSSKDHAPPPSRRGQGAIADIWLTPPAKLATQAGMHRFAWDLRYSVASATGPLAMPATYQARLNVGGKSYTQPLKVVLDPRSTGTPADLAKQFDLAMRAAREIGRASGVVRGIEDLRRQLGELKRNAAVVANPAIFTAITPLDADAEKLLVATRAVSTNLTAVLNVAESADRTPPSQAYALLDESAKSLDAQLGSWNALKGGRVAALNTQLRAKDLPAIP